MPWRSDYQRPRGWDRTRRRVLRRDPVCRACRTAPSTEVDHVVPEHLGGGHDEDNLQGLCADCHQRKTKAETAAARWRPERPRRVRPVPKHPGLR